MLDKETVIKAFDNLSRFVDTNVHPIVSPDNWNVYSQLRDMIDLIAEDALALLKEQEAVTIKKTKEHGFGVYGGICPKCRNWIQSAHSFCGFCGQAVKWE